MAESEGVALNQLINVAVAEKLSALRTEEYFRECAARANIKGQGCSEARRQRKAVRLRRREITARNAVSAAR